MRLLILTATVGMALVVAAPAGAGPPKFKGKTIVTGTSIGGVKVGMSKAKAIKVWGKPNECRSDQYAITTCLYVNASGQQSYGEFRLRKGKVIAVAIDKSTRLRTAKRIRIGSTMAAARKAYGIPAPTNQGEADRTRALYKKGKRCTQFYGDLSNGDGLVSQITVGLCQVKLYDGGVQ